MEVLCVKTERICFPEAKIHFETVYAVLLHKNTTIFIQNPELCLFTLCAFRPMENISVTTHPVLEKFKSTCGHSQPRQELLSCCQHRLGFHLPVLMHILRHRSRKGSWERQKTSNLQKKNPHLDVSKNKCCSVQN